MMRVALCVIFACAALAQTGCTATSCSRAPDELYVPLAHDLNLPDTDAGVAEGGAGGESDAGADAGTPTDPALLDGSVTLGNDYWSSSVYGPYTYFPAFRTVTFEHDLGGLPTSWGVDLTFSSVGTLATGSGNTNEYRDGEDADVRAITATTFAVYNNTCSEFYMRLWLHRASR